MSRVISSCQSDGLVRFNVGLKKVEFVPLMSFIVPIVAKFSTGFVLGTIWNAEKIKRV